MCAEINHRTYHTERLPLKVFSGWVVVCKPNIENSFNSGNLLNVTLHADPYKCCMFESVHNLSFITQSIADIHTSINLSIQTHTLIYCFNNHLFHLQVRDRYTLIILMNIGNIWLYF